MTKDKTPNVRRCTFRGEGKEKTYIMPAEGILYANVGGTINTISKVECTPLGTRCLEASDTSTTLPEIEEILMKNDLYREASRRLFRRNEQGIIVTAFSYYMSQLAEIQGNVDALYERYKHECEAHSWDYVARVTFHGWCTVKDADPEKKPVVLPLLSAERNCRQGLQTFRGMSTDESFNIFLDDLVQEALQAASQTLEQQTSLQQTTTQQTSETSPQSQEMNTQSSQGLSLSRLYEEWDGQRISAGRFISSYEQVLEKIERKKRENQGNQDTTEEEQEIERILRDHTPIKMELKRYLDSKDRHLRYVTLIENVEVTDAEEARQGREAWRSMRTTKSGLQEGPVRTHNLNDKTDNVKSLLSPTGFLMLMADVMNYYLRDYLRDEFRQRAISPSYIPDVINFMLIMQGFTNPYFKLLNRKYAQIEAESSERSRTCQGLREMSRATDKKLKDYSIDSHYEVSHGTFMGLFHALDNVFRMQSTSLWEKLARKHRLYDGPCTEHEKEQQEASAVEWYNILRHNRFFPATLVHWTQPDGNVSTSHTLLHNAQWYEHHHSVLNDREQAMAAAVKYVAWKGGRYVTEKDYRTIMAGVGVSSMLNLITEQYFLPDTVDRTLIAENETLMQEQLKQPVLLQMLIRGACDDFSSNPLKSIVEPADFSETAGKIAALNGKMYTQLPRIETDLFTADTHILTP